MVAAPTLRKIFRDAAEVQDTKLLRHAFAKLENMSLSTAHDEQATDKLLIECAHMALKVHTQEFINWYCIACDLMAKKEKGYMRGRSSYMPRCVVKSAGPPASVGKYCWVISAQI
jgi:hypothetical protein